MVALAILTTSAVALVALQAQASRAVVRARAAEDHVRRASAFLEAVVLWPRADLDRHLGERVNGAWWLRVIRPTTTLYVVELADSMPPHATLVRTAVYRTDRIEAAATMSGSERRSNTDTREYVE